MKLIVVLAILSGLLLALFLWLRPVLGSMGTPTSPNVAGHARAPVTDGTRGGALAQMPLASTLGPAMPRPGTADAQRAGVTYSDEIERTIFELVNQERAKAKVGPLALDGKLQEAARAHSGDMFVRGFFGHDDPDGFSPADRIAQMHRQLIGLTGENIWMGTNLDLSDQKRTAAAIMNDWMHSPNHKDNILKKDYTNLGVGVTVKGRDVRATQNFALTYALVEQAVPTQVHGGEGLNLAARPVNAGAGPERFEFFSSEKGMAIGGARLIAGATVPEPKALPAGVYKLRFLFPQGSAYWGPRIEVK